jgi:hypothetical protein
VHARRAFQPPQARRRDRDYAPAIVMATTPASPQEAGAGSDAPPLPEEKAAV